MSASPVASPPGHAADDRVVLPHVRWETDERRLANDKEPHVPQMTYDRGVLELVIPSLPPNVDPDAIASEFCQTATSAVLPPLTSEILTRFLAESRSLLHTAWIRRVREWARTSTAS